jgi:hypothetical protein
MNSLLQSVVLVTLRKRIKPPHSKALPAAAGRQREILTSDF